MSDRLTWLPSDRTMVVLAGIVGGDALNGHLDLIDPPWRALAQQLDQAPGMERVATLERYLSTLGCVEADIRSFEGRLIKESPGTSPGTAAARKLGITVLSRADLLTLPDPKWLIEGHIPQNCMACLYGPSGIGKSFLALHWLNCVATGIPWFGREVDDGPVAYIISEGAEGLKARQAAWEKHFYGGKLVERIAFISASLDLRKLEVPDLLLEALEPALKAKPKAVVIDTLARNMGGNENDTENMGLLVRSVDQIWQHTEGTPLIVHHTGKDGQSERGNGSLRNAAHTMMKLTKDEENQVLRLTCDKQRNAAEFEPWGFQMQEIALGVDAYGKPLNSCVLELTRSLLHVDRLPPMQERILDVLSWSINKRGVSSSKLREMIGALDETARTNMYRAVNRLKDMELIGLDDSGRVQTYAITDRGRDTIWAIKRQTEREEGDAGHDPTF